MQFRVFEKGIEVNGRTVHSVIDGLQNYKNLAEEYLLSVGIGEYKEKTYVLEHEKWYSQESWLKAFEKIAREVGDIILKQIGRKIPDNAQFPDWVKDIHSAIKSIDIAYHMNHRKNSQILYNHESGKMTEGIGHYGYRPLTGKNTIISVCENPYPCTFDEGILISMSKKFHPKAMIFHDSSKPCRRKGGDSCTYIISW